MAQDRLQALDTIPEPPRMMDCVIIVPGTLSSGMESQHVHRQESNLNIQLNDMRPEIPILYRRTGPRKTQVDETTPLPNDSQQLLLQLGNPQPHNSLISHLSLEGVSTASPLSKEQNLRPWHQEAQTLVEFAIDFTHQNWMSSDIIPYMMHCLGRELEHMITCLPLPLEVSRVAGDNETRDYSPVPNEMLPGHWVRSMGRPGNWGSLDNRDATSARDALLNRRYVAAMVHLESHWCSIIFDRVHRVLCYYDTMKAGRKDRAKAVGAYWREYLHTMGYGGPFCIVTPALDDQDQSWTCGYDALFILFHCIRSSAGGRIAALAGQPHRNIDGLMRDLDGGMVQALRASTIHTQLRCVQRPNDAQRQDFFLALITEELGNTAFGFLIPRTNSQGNQVIKRWRIERTDPDGQYRSRSYPDPRVALPRQVQHAQGSLRPTNLLGLFPHFPQEAITTELRNYLGLLTTDQRRAYLAEIALQGVSLVDNDSTQPPSYDNTPVKRSPTNSDKQVTPPTIRSEDPAALLLQRVLEAQSQGNALSARDETATTSPSTSEPVSDNERNESSRYHTLRRPAPKGGLAGVTVSHAQAQNFMTDLPPRSQWADGVRLGHEACYAGLYQAVREGREVNYDSHSDSYLSTMMMGQVSSSFWLEVEVAVQKMHQPPARLSREQRVELRSLPSDQKESALRRFQQVPTESDMEGLSTAASMMSLDSRPGSHASGSMTSSSLSSARSDVSMPSAPSLRSDRMSVDRRQTPAPTQRPKQDPTTPKASQGTPANRPTTRSMSKTPQQNK
jgi:hypothetical protein